MRDSLGGNRMPFQSRTASALLAIAACGSPRPAQSPHASDKAHLAQVSSPSAPHDSGKIADSLLRMNDISLGANPKEVRRLLGNPSAQDTSDSRETLGFLFITWHYPALDVEFADT